MQLAIVSDTHVPSRASGIPGWVRERVRAADHTVHAGDFDSREAYAEMEHLARELTAVAGNMDRGLDLPATATVEVGETTVVVTHGHGGGRGSYAQRVAATVRDRGGDVGVAGHTHDPTDERVDGVRVLNPGSATAASPASEATMMTAEPSDGGLDVTLHRG